MTETPLLEVSGLRVEFATASGMAAAVDDVSFSVAPGETVGLVGESGSGKTVTSLSIMGLLPREAGRLAGGSIVFDGTDLTRLSERRMRSLRGSAISMVFQEPMTSLNPAYTVGDQIAEAVRRHRGAGRRAAWEEAVRALDMVGIPGAARRARQYPHEFSGGMRQRVMLAIALVCKPRLLIADEPTTALDVTIQAQLLDLLAELRRELGMSMLFVTHDLGVVAEICDRVVVMYAGQVVEQAPARAVFHEPAHPYTAALLAAMPQAETEGEELAYIPGRPPALGAWPDGCRFADRCGHVAEVCASPVSLAETGEGRAARCARTSELVLGGAR
ncbi:MAG: ATP-binding cassette domain-containing protein [Streptosporangiales bacterium]|nr:ATP-binding cassette domain-containing protein [Streptosporangiales bacterium]